MLAQFQALYPTGSLISELLQIYQGKFIVRVAAAVEGETRATGMAAAETLEVAEDRARSRALLVLGIQPKSSTQPESHAPQSATSEVQMPALETALSPPIEQMNQSSSFATSNDLGNEIDTSNPSFPTQGAAYTEASHENIGIMSNTTKESSVNPPIPLSNVTPLVPRSQSQDSLETLDKTGDKAGMAASEPVDLTDAIARTSEELKRLGWSNQQGRQYLEKTYGKRSRQQLSDEEMLEFLHYLESQPSPTEPFA